MRVKLKTTLCNVGAHPHGLAGVKIGCHAVECHDNEEEFDSFSIAQKRCPRGESWTPLQLSPDNRIALQIGYSSLFIVDCDRVKNLQDLISIVTLTEQGDCKFESHFRNEVSVNEERKFREQCEQENRRTNRMPPYVLPHPKS